MADSMRVNLGGTDAPGFPNNQYCVVSFDTVVEDATSLWSNSNRCITMPAAGVITFNWQVWIDAQASQYGDSLNGQFVGKLIKNCTINSDGTPNYGSNGVDVFASIGTPCAQPGVAVTSGGCSDRCVYGDTYTLFLWASAGAGFTTVTVNGNPAHTQLSATFIED